MQDHGRLTAVHIPKLSPSHHVETLSRSRSVVECAHIQAFTLKFSRSRLVVDCAHIQTFVQKTCRHVGLMVHACWTPWSTLETRGLWARPPVLTPVPVQAFHSRVCLNLHHCDIQGTAQKSPCVNIFLRPLQKKRRPSCHCLGVWAGHQRTRLQRDTTHGTTDT